MATKGFHSTGRDKVACDVCGRDGYDGAFGRPVPWQESHLRGHSACPDCGALLTLKADGTPRKHQRQHCKPKTRGVDMTDRNTPLDRAKIAYALGMIACKLRELPITVTAHSPQGGMLIFTSEGGTSYTLSLDFTPEPEPEEEEHMPSDLLRT